MRKTTKKALSLLLAIVLVMTTFVAFPITSEATESPLTLEEQSAPIWADPSGVLDQSKVDAFVSGTSKTSIVGGIAPFKRSTSSSKYYWFLPSNADLSALKIWYGSGVEVRFNGYLFESGSSTDQFASINEGGTSMNVSILIGSTTYDVTVMKSGEVGTVFIDTNSGSISKITNSSDHSAWEAGTIMVVQPDGTVDYMGELSKMSGRGNGTWSTTSKKNPYNIKLATSTSLLGMDKAKKWCLLANSGDSTLIKNQLTYDFSKYIGVKYQPICKPVDLYVNQQYYGSYQLSEKVEIKSGRINLSSDIYDNVEIANGTVNTETGAITPADLTGTVIGNYTHNSSTGADTAFQSNPTGSFSSDTVKGTFGQTTGNRRYSNITSPNDITGGYVYELEITLRWPDDNAGFCGYNRQGWVIKNCDYATKDMVDYSYDLLYALGSSIYNNGIVPSTATSQSNGYTVVSIGSYVRKNSLGTSAQGNPAPAVQYQGKKWSDILNADSAVKYYWTQEFFKNMDSSVSSTYFYKDSDSVDSMLYAGPVWDMDNTIGLNGDGSRWGLDWQKSTGWFTKSALMYRYNATVSYTGYTSSDNIPLSFYAALATNCSDFWDMAGAYWYNLIEPATLILTGEKSDATGTLKSVDEYIDTVSKSGYMNSVRHDLGTYSSESNNVFTVNTSSVSSMKSSVKSWFNERSEWISAQIPKTDISSASLSAISDKTYTGAPLEPDVELTYNGNILKKDVDYTLTYSENTDVGTAGVTINGIGSFEGTRTTSFKITSNSLTTATAEIPESSYIDTELKAVTRDASGNELTNSVSYQWNRNGTPISGATDSMYMTTSEDSGSSLTVTVTGDGVNITGAVTSNTCEVAQGAKPQGYQRTIAAWDYSYSTDSTALADASGNYTYMATSGENMATSSLGASVTATSRSELKWSGTKDLYKTDGVSDQAPIMGTSKTSGIAWGQYPYFEAVVSTLGYEEIKFSGRVGGTNKAPRDWKLQYSLDGVNFTDIDNTTYSITANKNMELAFDNVSLPAECSNQSRVYIRMVVANDISISGIAIVNQPNGDAAVNNVAVTGVAITVVTELNAPSFVGDASIYNTENVNIYDNNGGADVYYSLDGENYTLYTGEFNPFNEKTSNIGDVVTVSAYSYFNDIISDVTTQQYIFRGVDINDFVYSDYSKDVTLGAVASTGGVYGESGRMTAYTDSTTQYVPLWSTKNGSFAVSPDDGTYWTENSGFTYQIATAGYENIHFSCKGYTTAQGPNSITLQYSTDGVNFYNVQSNIVLPANKTLENIFVDATLPVACNNLTKLYVRLATTENLTNEGNTLHNNLAKGNLYINNVVISGEDDGSYKMPYTNKSTNYFGDSGVINYVSPDSMPIKYVVVDSSSNIVQNGIVPETGIQLSTVKGFDNTRSDEYTVMTMVEEDENQSLVNTATYRYKGDTVVKFNFNSKTKLFEDYVSDDAISVSNTSGANAGTLSMYPNGSAPTVLSYTGTYGVKVSYTEDNPFSGNKNVRDNPNASGVGYWLIETSTLGYKNLTLNLEQLSSNNGPRDWGVAYSTNGTSYTYVANSNARAISNDSSTDTVETYGNLPLPSSCNNQQKLYIKIFINGGEAVNGDEFALLTKGNTGINKIEINGTPEYESFTVNATVLETKTSQTGSIGVSNADIYVNGRLAGTTNNNGVATVSVPMNYDFTLTVDGNKIVKRDYSVLASSNAVSANIPVLIFDVNEDGFINAKDYAIINKDSSYNNSKQYFSNFINTKTSEFSYQ